jgi:hypothetical protein
MTALRSNPVIQAHQVGDPWQGVGGCQENPRLQEHQTHHRGEGHAGQMRDRQGHAAKLQAQGELSGLNVPHYGPHHTLHRYPYPPLPPLWF